MKSAHPVSSDEIVRRIESSFEVPERVADKVKNFVEKTRGGYVLIESRPPWDGSSGPWNWLSVAKIILHKPSGRWKIYWRRASGKWELYGQYKTLAGGLRVIKEDKHGCFWG